MAQGAARTVLSEMASWTSRSAVSTGGQEGAALWDGRHAEAAVEECRGDCAAPAQEHGDERRGEGASKPGAGRVAFTESVIGLNNPCFLHTLI